MHSRFERFSFAITEIYRYLHKISSDEMKKYGLKGPYAIYLVAMNRYEDGVTATQLCEICSRNKADVSRAMAELEEKGLVTRVGTSYRALLKLTEEGKSAAGHLCERAGIAVDIGSKGLTDESRMAMYDALELIAANMREMSNCGVPENDS